MVFLRFYYGVDPCQYLECQVVSYTRPSGGMLRAWMVRFGGVPGVVWVE